MRNTPLTAKKLNTLVAVAHLEEIAEQLGPDWQKPICDIIDILQSMPDPAPDELRKAAESCEVCDGTGELEDAQDRLSKVKEMKNEEAPHA